MVNVTTNPELVDPTIRSRAPSCVRHPGGLSPTSPNHTARPTPGAAPTTPGGGAVQSVAGARDNISGATALRHRILFCLVLSLGGLCMGNAQAEAVCSNTPGDGDWILCTKDSTSTDNIEIKVDGVEISTTGNNEHGIKAEHAGGTAATNTDPAAPANIMIDVTGTATKKSISTTGETADGVHGMHTGTGDVDIDVTGVGISTAGGRSRGVYGKHTGTGNVDIDVTGVGISTSGTDSRGVYGEHTGTGNIDIHIEGATTGRKISTEGTGSDGVFVKHTGTGTGDNHVDIDLEDIEITTTGGTTGSAGGVRVERTGDGDVDIDAARVSLSTTGSDSRASDGVHVRHEGSGDINISFEGTAAKRSTVTTTAGRSHGIYARKRSSRIGGSLKQTSGNIAITLGNTRIDTSGEVPAVYAEKDIGSSGMLTANLNSGVTITTQGQGASGVHLAHMNNEVGALDNDVTLTANGITIETAGDNGHGLQAARRTGRGDVTIDVDRSMITTGGTSARGIIGYHFGNSNLSDVTIDVDRSTITTEGNSAYGIYGYHFGDGKDGDITIDVDGSTITTEGNSASGILGYHTGDGNDGDITIDATNGGITTGSAIEEGGTTTRKGSSAHGIYAFHGRAASPVNSAAVGDIRITTRNLKIQTTGTTPPDGSGTFAYGIYAIHQNSGDIVIDLGQGSSVTTEGQNSHGIVTYHFGTAATRTMDITLGGPVSVNGAGAQGVRVGAVGASGPERMAALDEEGYRRQTVTVNSRIESQGEGVFLANGGRVIIGPKGSIHSDSGIAILATGTVPEVPEVPEDASDPLNIIPAVPAIPAIPPKLRVDMNLGGRRVSQAIGDGWILNDGGETTIAMNGVVLHDGVTGVTEETARNGAYNVSMVADGVKVTDRTNADPEMWTVSERDENVIVIADRDFSATDFPEERRPSPPPPPPPPPPPEPDPPPVAPAKLQELTEIVVANALGGIVLSLFGEQETSASSSPFIEEYAPRAAVYEALPTALLGLNDAGQGTGTPRPQGTFTFARTLEEHGGLSPASSTVGQRHALGYGGVQFGRRLRLGETLEASTALHRVWSTVDVEAGTGGGEIGVEATGLVLDGAWNGPEGFYARTGLSMTHYRLGTWSEDRAVGKLAGGVGARGSLARIEAGREVSLGGGRHVAPRIWVKRSALSVDDFTDAVGSRVSVPGTSRVSGGVGMTARAERRAGSGMLSLRGSVDLAHVIDGTVAVTDVSGARLASEAEETELRLALSGVYRQGRFSLAAEASMNGSEPGDARGAVGLRLAASF